MLELGKYNNLKVVDKLKDAFVLDYGVKLFFKETLDQEFNIGDLINVFVYNDVDKGIVATLRSPLAEVDDLALLKVVETNELGAFLDLGIAKDVLLLKNKMEYDVSLGDEILVFLRLDNKKRISATMRISDYLEVKENVKIGDIERGIIYRVNPHMGIFLAIDGKYHGFIHNNKLDREYTIGEKVEARVTNIRPDGKVELSLKEPLNIAMDKDSKLIYDYMLKRNGELDLNDKSDSDLIKRKLNLSKKAFKRAVGKLYKEEKIVKIEGFFRIKK